MPYFPRNKSERKTDTFITLCLAIPPLGIILLVCSLFQSMTIHKRSLVVALKWILPITISLILISRVLKNV